MDEYSNLELDMYQEMAHRTAVYPSTLPGTMSGEPSVYPLIGLCGEVGELANKWKKVLRDFGGVMSEEAREKLMLELGDCLWYISEIAGVLGFHLSVVAARNLLKLDEREKRNRISGEGDHR